MFEKRSDGEKNTTLGLNQFHAIKTRRYAARRQWTTTCTIGIDVCKIGDCYNFCANWLLLLSVLVYSVSRYCVTVRRNT